MNTLGRFGVRLIIGLLLIALSSCASTTSTPTSNDWYPGVSNLPPEQQMQMIQTMNADWAAEQQREQEIWNRLTPQPQTIYVQPRW